MQYSRERETLPENYRNFPFWFSITILRRDGVRACRYARKNARRQCILISKEKTRSPIHCNRSFIEGFDIAFQSASCQTLRRGLSF